uniref:Uncharacterized protein n=1 Tax=Timema douglasi TaxID=61478 RepID=A0A7R8VXU6_TIMDO|nr:unnamed protein product [Timema douglasi]
MSILVSQIRSPGLHLNIGRGFGLWESAWTQDASMLAAYGLRPSQLGWLERLNLYRVICVWAEEGEGSSPAVH